MYAKNHYSALAHHLYNQTVPIQILHRQHDIYDKDLEYHSHDFMELVIVTEGSATHSVLSDDGKPYNYPIERGFSFIVNIGDIHTYLFEGEQSLTVENIIFDPTVLNQLDLRTEADKQLFDFIYLLPQLPIEIKFGASPLLNSQQFNYLGNLYEMLYQEQKQNLIGGNAIKLSLLNLMLFSVSREYLGIYDPTKYKISSEERNILALIGYLKQHYNEEISLEKLAEMFHYGVRHLTRQFKKTTGETIFEYVKHLRMTKACSLLHNTEIKVSDIASRVGISNCSLFCKTFKESMDMSPTEYRALKEGEGD